MADRKGKHKMYALMPYIKLGKLSLCTGLILLGLCLFSTVSSARSHCQVKETQLLSLSNRLERAESPKAWQAIYQESLTALELIEKNYFSTNAKTSVGSTQTRAQLLCVQELLFESSFFLSDDRVKGALWSMRALGHAVSLSSLSPTTLRRLETKDRLRLLLKRINRRKKGERKIQKSFKFGKHQTVFIPAQSKPYHLQLSIKEQASWLKRCGLFEGCKDASIWNIYTKVGSELSIYLPISDYKLEWSGACVQHNNELAISSLQKSKAAIKVPKLACFSEIELIDELSQEVISLFEQPATERPQVKVNGVILTDYTAPLKALENSEISVKYTGYKAKKTTIPTQGKKLKLFLKRCAVNLLFKTQPTDLEIEGPKRVYWGQSYTINFKRNGYLPLTKSIIVTKPKNCSNPKHTVDVMLTRQVEIKAYDPEGLKVKLSKLKVGGLSVNSQESTFRRPEGHYQVIAQTQDYPQLIGQLHVPPCEYSRCEQAFLNLYFQNPPPPPMTTKTQFKWIGTSLLSAGLGLFVYNVSANHYRDQELNYSTPLNPIQEQLSYVNSWSIALVSSGLFTIALGYAWPYLTSDQNVNTQMTSSELQKDKR